MKTPSRSPEALRALFLSVAALAALPVCAQEGDGAARQAAAPDTHLAVLGTVGHAVDLNGSVDVDVDTLFVRYSHVIGDGARVLGGEPSWGVEVGVLRFDQEPDAVGFGFHLIYEHRFAPAAAVQPLLTLGAGALLSDQQVPPEETRHNFSLFAGLGVEARLGGGVGLQVGYRLHHVSNADTGFRNPGINSHTVAAGLVIDL